MSEWHESARAEYKKIGEIECPAFPTETVVFNAKGFSHLMYQGSSKEKARPEKESKTRVSLVPRAVKLLQMMSLPQEESEYEVDGKKFMKMLVYGLAFIRTTLAGHKQLQCSI